MRVIAVSQRIVRDDRHGERRDALDQRWTAHLAARGLAALPIPNAPDTALALVASVEPAGILLTGGGDIDALGGADPERDATEAALIGWARDRGKPILGVCRGMQALQHLFGVALGPVRGHVATRHGVAMDGARFEVNSFHAFGARETVPALHIRAISDDGVVEAIRHSEEPIFGIMWHPERDPAMPAGAPDIVDLAFNAGTAR